MKLLYLILIALSIFYCASALSSSQFENDLTKRQSLFTFPGASNFLSLTTNNALRDAAEYKKQIERRRDTQGQEVFDKDTYQKRQRY